MCSTLSLSLSAPFGSGIHPSETSSKCYFLVGYFSHHVLWPRNLVLSLSRDGKTKRRLHDRKTEHFKALAKNDNTSAIADHVKATGHNIKWDHFDILAKGKTENHCKIKETLYIQELEPAFNVNVGSEKLMLY